MDGISEILVERPVGFTVEERHFYIWPMTLGKLTLIRELTGGLNTQYLELNPFLELLGLVSKDKDKAARIIAYAICKRRDEVFDEEKIQEHIEFFKEHIEDGDMAALLITILTKDNTDKVIKETGIDKEQRRMQKVMEMQDNKHNVSFGGSTIYGTLIDVACERYGWTVDYVVWDISYASLRLLLADKVSQLYLTDEERKKCRGLLHRKTDVVSADTNSKKVRELIKATFKD